jgi:hypothetical protein
MRHFSTYAVGFVLTVLLVSTTPVGTGGTAHQFDLLHPLFSHVHIVNGRVMTHEQMADQRTAARSAPAQPADPRGPTLGSGSGSAPDGAGLGATPTVPMPAFYALVPAAVVWPVFDGRLPRGREEAPPDPPPLT